MSGLDEKNLNQPLTASVGILMLETRFPRFIGDIGNADTWQFPVIYKTVLGSSASAALSTDNSGLLEPFICAAKELVTLGVDGITTSCGFLSLFQKQLSRALDVPVATSALMQVPWVQGLLPPGKRVGILTVHAKNLTARHLIAAGAAPDTPVAGTETFLEFTGAILADEAHMDFEACRKDNLQAAGELTRQHPEVGAIVLECTNMAPYAADIQHLTGLPVYSIYTLINWFQSGLVPRRF